MALSLVQPPVMVVWPWHLRIVEWLNEHPRGDNCRDCGRDVACPQNRRVTPVCVYCAMDAGLLEAIDRPLWSDQGGSDEA